MKKLLSFSTNAFVVCLLTSCSLFGNEDNMDNYSVSNDPLINREESLPLDKELEKLTENKTDAVQNAVNSETPAIAVPAVKINTMSLNEGFKQSLTDLNLSQASQKPTVSVKQLNVSEVARDKTAETSVKILDEKTKIITPVSTNIVTASQVNAVQTKKQEVEQKIADKTEILQEAPKKIEDKQPANIAAGSSSDQGQSVPSNASVGECYGRVKVAGQFKDVMESVEVEPAKTKTEVIPAKYGYKSEEMIVKEEAYKFVQIPATYKNVVETVVVEPERKEVVTIPAKYNDVTERVMIKPATKVWKKGRGLIQKTGEDGEVMCLREEPAVYDNVTKKVLVEAERTETKIIPAVTKQITKQVVDQPARVEKLLVPAEKQTIQKKIVLEPEQTKTVEVPAVKKLVRKRITLSEDKTSWLPIVCNDNLREGLVSQIQVALVNKGYKLKPDGFFGKETANAVDAYQKSLGYESSGITLETLKTLGIAY